MMSIQEALAQLDPENDKHWTGSGRPKLSVVRELTGDQSISAKQLKEASPGFVRKAEDKEEKKAEPAVDTSKLSDEELFALVPEQVYQLDRDTQYRYVDICQQVATNSENAARQAKDDVKAAMQKLTPVKEKLEYKTPKEKEAEDNRNLYNWLQAQKENKARKVEFIDSLNLPGRLRGKALRAKGTKAQKLANALQR